MLTKYLEFLLEEAVVEKDWENYFSGLFDKISSLSQYFEVEPQILVKHSARKIHLLRSLKYSAAFHLGRNDLQMTMITMEEFSLEVQKLFYYSLFSNAFIANPKYFYLDLIYSCQELTFSLILLVNSKIYLEVQNDLEENFISLYEFFVFFGLFHLTLTLESWAMMGQIIDEIQEFFKRIEKNKLAFLNENVDYLAVFSDLRMMTEKTSNFKLKNKKSLKNDDIFSEIFQNDFSSDFEQNFSTHQLEEPNMPKFLFKTVIKYLSAAFFQKNLKKNIFKLFKIDKESTVFEHNAFNIQNIVLFISELEHKAFRKIKAVFNKMGGGELNLMLNDIKMILQNIDYIPNSTYFSNVHEIIHPQTLAYLSKKCNFEENFDLIQVKVFFLNFFLFFKIFKILKF